MLNHKTCYKYQKIKIIQWVFSDHSVRKLENNSWQFGKFIAIWTLNITVIKKTVNQRGSHSRNEKMP